ncbi:polysaccharide lyase family 8 super-sandwich domain-containing protein [Paraferrimonas sp. SM1919]|uniref:polysaccharide lyase family 8 super-sandwich domain-containing protein n=1 Tax=Paraferrimonas sp. SM1919 TaxID=2662263 RepID=UPI0013D35FF3|nr:polysaccharide lyase family 8 super-sandwich domain-containing protein [Paraferrimonas sp. SM1919]
MKLTVLLFTVMLISPVALGSDVTAKRFDNLLIWDKGVYQQHPHLKLVYQNLQQQFSEAVTYAENYDYSHRSQLIKLDFKLDQEDKVNTSQRQLDKQNKAFQELLTNTLPKLAYAYHTPSPTSNKFYKNPKIKQQYLNILEYAYQRGVNEQAWIVDHGGTISKKLLAQGFNRPAGDLSSMSLHLGGLAQSIFLMRNELQQARLLDKYRKVLAHLVINNAVMAGSFFEYANDVTVAAWKIKQNNNLKPYYLNADGMRLFVDYFVPYFLLLDDPVQKAKMADVLINVAKTNIAVLPGAQGTIKPDGSGFHHQNAYIGAYAPFTLEAMAQLIYLTAGDIEYTEQQKQALKLALTSFREMMHNYTVSNSLSGRLINNDSAAAAIAINKAMAFLGHPDGINDHQMQASFKEFYDETFVSNVTNAQLLYEGKRGVDIRGLGIFSLLAEVDKTATPKLQSPQGLYVKPYANAGFVHGKQWMATIKGFSQYLWDYEGPINKRQNSFGQNWSYGLLELQVGDQAMTKVASGLDIEHGFDWYHMPGTTASYYPIVKRDKRELVKLRSQHKIKPKDPQRNYNQRTFVGGVSAKGLGIFAIDLQAVAFDKPTNLTARKSYFVIDDKIIAIGTDINGGTQIDPTHTTLFQTKVTPKALSAVNWLNGKALNKKINIELDGQQAHSFIDAVGNSYLLRKTNAKVHAKLQQQQSLTPRYKKTTGDYYSVYLDHGIQPQAHYYEYVVLPQSKAATTPLKTLQELEQWYQVESTAGVHAVSFLKQQAQAYAFYETSITPNNMIVQTVNMQSLVLTQSQEKQLQLFVSVPDLGWQPSKVAEGIKYDNAQTATHALEVTLRGRWQSTDAKTKIRYQADTTIVTLSCKDGKTVTLALKRA